MDPASLQDLYSKIVQCSAPEALFGELQGSRDEMLAAVLREYKRMMVICHPDRYPELAAKKMADEACQHLALLLDDAKKRIAADMYGKPYSVARGSPIGSVETSTREYRITAVLAEGAISTVYLGEFDEPNGNVERVVIKVANEASDNELIENEQRLLRKLSHISLPVLVDTFVADDDRAGSVLRFIDGYDLPSLRERPRYRNGVVPHEHIGWIMERQLSVIGYLHSQMVVHGNIEPSHLIVVPRTHNVYLIDLCFAVSNPSSSDFIRMATENYSAPEVYRKSSPLPTMDLFSLGRSMIYLLGGDPASDRLPESLDSRIVSFIKHLTEPNYLRRARDAWQMANLLVSLRTEVYGPRRFLEFPV